MRFFILLLTTGMLVALMEAAPPPGTKPASLNDGKDLLRLVRIAIRAYDGEKLATEEERTEAAYAMGYLKGVKEASWILGYENENAPYILPMNFQGVHLAKVIERFLTVYPDKQSKPPYEIIALAFTEAFKNPKWKPLPRAP